MLRTFCVAFITSELARGGYALRSPQDPWGKNELIDLDPRQIDDLEPGVFSKEILMKRLSDKFWYLHIPKAAGTSWSSELKKIWPEGLQDAEGCYGWSRTFQINGTPFLMLRRPADHVLSMYYHCTASGCPPQWAKDMMPKQFGEWVHRWTKIAQRGGAVGDFEPAPRIDLGCVATYNSSVPFKCYNPVNLQVQRMTCERPYLYPAHANEGLAVRNMHSAAFVGIVEAFQESVCLLSANMTGKLLSGCNCENKAEWDSMNLTHTTHGVTVAHSIADYPESVLDDVNQLTKKDRILYRESVRRFIKDIGVVEQKHGVKILCEDTKQALQRD